MNPTTEWLTFQEAHDELMRCGMELQAVELVIHVMALVPQPSQTKVRFGKFYSTTHAVRNYGWPWVQLQGPGINSYATQYYDWIDGQGWQDGKQELVSRLRADFRSLASEVDI